MTKQRLPLLLTVLLLIGFVLPASASAPPKDPPPKVGQKAGTISALLPVARIQRGVAKSMVTTDAKKGDDVQWNDNIVTERGGRARITLLDQSILSLGSQASLRIVTHNRQAQQTSLEMAYGRVRAEVARVTRQGGSFELKTPTAVAGVIGTDFGTDASTVGTTTFICISGLVQVGNVDPNIAGSVQCAPGMTTSVQAGKAPTPPANATPEQIQQLIADTEPAIISAMSPLTAMPGGTVDAVINGAKLAGIKTVTVTPDGSGVTAALVGTPTDTSATVHIVVAPTATPGPRTIHLQKQSGADSAAVFTIMAPPTATAGDPKKGFHDQFESERQQERAGLGAFVSGVKQTADQAQQQLQQQNTGNTDLSAATTSFNGQVAAVQSATDAAGNQIDAAVAQAVAAFDAQFQTINAALLQRNPSGAPDDQFNQALLAAFNSVNATLGNTLKSIHENMIAAVSNANTQIAQLQNTWMTTISQSGQQPPTPNVNATERSIDLGAAFGTSGITALDGGSSRGSAGASIISYKWVLCDSSYKPAQFGVPLAGNATAGCNALPGFQSSSSDFQFATCSLQPNDYIARLTITDSNNKSSAIDVKVHVLAPNYDDPSATFRSLASAFETRQPNQFLGFFDENNFPGFTSLAENVRSTFPQLASMSINLRLSQASINCNEATVRADWQQNYTFASAPNVPFTQTEQLSARMTRTPGKGWKITDFQGDNGKVQGVPAIVSQDTSTADLYLATVGLVNGKAADTLIVPKGAHDFVVAVQNVGTKDVTQPVTVQFTLGTANPIAVVIPGPIAAGGQAQATATLTIPDIVPGSTLPLLVNITGCNTTQPETTCDNNSKTVTIQVGNPIVLTQLNSPLNLQVGGPAQKLNISVTDATAMSISLPAGITAAEPLTQTLSAAGTFTWTLSAGFTANNSSPLAAITVTTGGSFPVSASINYTLAPPQFAQTAQPTLIAGGAAQPLSVSVNVPGTFTFTVPSGITIASCSGPGVSATGTACGSMTTTAAGTLTWNIQSSFSAASGTNLNAPIAAGIYGFTAHYSNGGATFTQTAAPKLIAGGVAQTLSVQVNTAGTFTLTLPAGVTTTSTNPQTLPATGGTLNWNIQSDLTAASGTSIAATIAASGTNAPTFTALFSIAAPQFSQTSAPALIAGGVAQSLNVQVTSGGTYTLVLPQGITTTSPNPQTLPAAGGGLSWDIASNLTAASGTALTTTITGGIYSFTAQYSNVGPTFTQTAPPALIAGGPALTLSVQTNAGGTFTLALPAGVSTTSANPQTLPAAGGTLNWDIQSALTVAAAANLPATITASGATTPVFSAAFSVTAPQFAQTATPALIAGGPAQPLTVTVNAGGTYTLALPQGVTTTSANPQTLPAAGGTLTWNLASDLTAASGSALTTAINGGVYGFKVSYSNTGPNITQTATPSLIAGGPAQTLSVVGNVAGTYTLTLPTGISIVSCSAPGVTSATGTACASLAATSAGTLTWNIRSDFTAAAGTGLHMTVALGPYTFQAAYSNAGPTFTQTATPSLIAGDSTAQPLSVSVNTPGTYSFVPPVGTSIASCTAGGVTVPITTCPNLTITAAGTLTWNLRAGLSATVGTALTTNITAGQYTFAAAYAVAAPTITETSSAALQSGGPAQPLTIQSNIPGTFVATLPTGVTFAACTAPGVSASGSGCASIVTTGAGTLTYYIQADFTAATGTLTMNLNVSGSTYGLPATFTVGAQPNYVITSLSLSGHAAPPYTGANAMQAGENASLIAVISNVGNGSPVGTIDVVGHCTPLDAVNASSCTNSTPVVTVAAPAAGQSVTATVPASMTMPVGQYTGTVTLATAIVQSSTADDTSTALPFDIVDFSLSLNQSFGTGTQLLLPNSSQTVNVVTSTSGPSTFTIPLAANAGGYSGITIAPTAATVGAGTQTFTVSSALSAPTGNFTFTVTGTRFGVSHSVTQQFLVASAQINSTNLFLNDSSNPLEIQKSSTSPQVVGLKLNTSASSFPGSGSATLVPPTSSVGFTTSINPSNTTTANGTFDLGISATTSATATVTPLTLAAQLPNTQPTTSVFYTVYVKAIGLPDLTVVSATPSVTLTSSSPWLDGMAVDYSVVIKNNGTNTSAGNETISITLNGYDIGDGLAPSLAPGQTSSPIVIHAVAPDVHGNATFSGSGALAVKVDADAAGDTNYADNTLSTTVPLANWHIAPNVQGTSGTPLTLYIFSGGPWSTPAPYIGVVDGSNANISTYPSGMFNPVAGQTSTSLSVGNFDAACSTYFTSGPPAGTSFCATVSTSDGTLQPGAYFAQVIVQMMDGTTVTAQRQATSYVTVNSSNGGSVTVTPTLTPSADNCTGTGCALTSGHTQQTLQLNGGLAEQFSVTLNLTCNDGVNPPSSCPGQADLAIHDATNTDTSALTSTTAVPTGSPVVLKVSAAMDPNGNITSGAASGYVIGVSGVQHQIIALKRGTPTSPDPVGVQVQMLINVGDIDIFATGPHGSGCMAIAPGGGAVPLTISWSPSGGFNSPSLSWQWEDANHSPVGASPVSFSTSSGVSNYSGGTYSTLPGFNVTNNQPQDGLLMYFFAVTISNGTSTGTKYFPFYFDLSTSQNFCGAVGSARGFSRVAGSWSRSAAGSGGPITSSLRTAAAVKPESGTPDVHLIPSDVSFTPSVPKVGDQVQVRFRVRNDGNAAATGMPIALQVNGVTVASDTFDVPAGSSVLGGLTWTAARPTQSGTTLSRPKLYTRAAAKQREVEGDPADAPMAAPVGPITASVVVDPQHTVVQKSTADKSAPLAHFVLRDNAAVGDTLVAASGSQRILLELEEGACAGLRLSTGGNMPCGSADLEITIADLGKSTLSLDSLSGVGDAGASFVQNARRTGRDQVRFSAQASGLAGHTYAVQLPSGKVATVNIESVRNPAELDAKARALFRASATRVLKNLGDSGAAPETGDLTGGGSHPSIFIVLNVQGTN